MTTQATSTLNGLDTQRMFETLGAIQADPSLAQFQFRARNRWISGGANQSTIQDFYGAGREDDSRTEPFVFTNGEPPVLLGANEGANPVEYLLHALAGCVTTTLVLHAAARGIRIESIHTEMEGEMDLQKMLGLREDLHSGYKEIRMKMDVQADCSDEELEQLMAFVKQRSPVCTTVCQPVPVILERVRVTQTA